MKKDYYKVLGIRRDADASEIKRAYRKLAKKYHPDSNEGNAHAAEKFKEANEAYDILGDEKKRKLYDQYGTAAFDETAGGFDGEFNRGFGGGYDGGFNRGFGGGFAGGDGSRSRNTAYHTYGDPSGSFHEYHFEGGEDMDDILKNIFGSSGAFHKRTAGGYHAGGFGETQFKQDFPEKGADIQSNIEVAFDDAAFGGKKRIQIQNENGQIQSLEVNIPAGIADGKVIRLKGKGMPGRNGGASGDLLLRVTVHDKPGYHRQGQDVYTVAAVPFTTAALGGEQKIPTIHGDVVCKIREGTQSGTKIRLKGKGIVTMGRPSVCGDQYVTIEVQVPKNLTPEAKKKLQEFEQLCQNNSRTYRDGHAA